jgi:hypothetical protein
MPHQEAGAYLALVGAKDGGIRPEVLVLNEVETGNRVDSSATSRGLMRFFFGIAAKSITRHGPEGSVAPAQNQPFFQIRPIPFHERLGRLTAFARVLFDLSTARCEGQLRPSLRNKKT